MRLKKALEFIRKSKVENALVLKKENIYYITGFFPSVFCVLVLSEKPELIVHEMDKLNAEKIKGSLNIEVKPVKKFSKELKKLKLKGKIGIEKGSTTIDFFEKYVKRRKISGISFEEMRKIKDAEEIKNIKKGIEISKKILEEISKNLEGKREKEIAAEIMYETLLAKNSESAFEPIVASGFNSCIPHHEAGEKRIGKNESIIIDMGVKYNRYCTDMTRTFCLNENKSFLELHEIVKEAQKAGIRELKSNNLIKNADIALRKVLGEYKVEKLFLHAAGHGIGLEVHEQPRISSDEKGKAENGMVVTIEPGVYGYRNFGIRIEDIVLVDGGPRVLT